MLPSAFEAIGRFSRSAGAACFLDYDGTLSPIAARPELAVLDPLVRASVARLASVAPVAIISGRALDDVRELVAVPGLIYGGAHGLDVAYPDGRREVHGNAELARRALAEAADALAERCAETPGVLLEDKRFALAVHVRQAPEAVVPAVRRAVLDVVADHPALRFAEGKRVFELLPDVEWDKGALVRALLGELERPPGHLVAYVGDDLTDEHAFRAIADDPARGLPIVVGERASDPGTYARFALDDPSAVQQWIDLVAARLGAPPA